VGVDKLNLPLSTKSYKKLSADYFLYEGNLSKILVVSGKLYFLEIGLRRIQK